MFLKKTLILVTILLMPLVGHSACDKPSAKICKIMQDALSGKYSPEELCSEYDGSFCSSMKTMGQAVCASMGEPFCSSYEKEGEALCEAVDGNFCATVETVAGGICSILDGSFCSSETDERKWKRKLSEACYW